MERCKPPSRGPGLCMPLSCQCRGIGPETTVVLFSAPKYGIHPCILSYFLSTFMTQTTLLQYEAPCTYP